MNTNAQLATVGRDRPAGQAVGAPAFSFEPQLLQTLRTGGLVFAFTTPLSSPQGPRAAASGLNGVRNTVHFWNWKKW
jgi:hypothetical protein